MTTPTINTRYNITTRSGETLTLTFTGMVDGMQPQEEYRFVDDNGNAHEVRDLDGWTLTPALTDQPQPDNTFDIWDGKAPQPLPRVTAREFEELWFGVQEVQAEPDYEKRLEKAVDLLEVIVHKAIDLHHEVNEIIAEPISNRPETINDALALWGHSTYNPEMGSLKGYALKIARYIAQVQEAPQGDVMKPFNDSLHVSIFEDATKPACQRGGFFDYEQFTDLGISHLYRLSCYKVEYAGWLPEVIMQDAIATLEAQLLSTLQALYDGSEKDFLEFKFYRERMLRRYEQF